MRIVEGFQSAKKELEELRKTSPLYLGSLESEVKHIIERVRGQGDTALYELTLEFDRIKLNSLEITEKQVSDAYGEVDDEVVAALKLAADRVRSFHTAQRAAIWGEVAAPGLKQLTRPLQRVGVYVPGGTASYPSTVLMTAIPARVAGVEEVIMVTPPGSNMSIPPLTLVAADIAKVDRIFSVGGAQAIAALAYGTETIPRVDKICGPGNIFVVLAKKMVYGEVGIDGLQGPSEVVIIADETANPVYCAADLLAQAEHDSLASAILITTSRCLADGVNREVRRQLEDLPRRAIATESLEKRGMIALVDAVDEAIELANLYAPEHLCLMLDEPASCIDRVLNAGCIVTGKNSTVVLGDYVAGPSHALPTGGTARFSSPLNVADFIKFINVVNIDDAGLKELGRAAQVLASVEGLDAHARAVQKRLEALG